MLLLNFGHRLREDVLKDIRRFIGKPLDSLLEFPVQFDHEEAFEKQVIALVDQVGISSKDWQTREILVNPPTHPLVALGVMAELHGRMGYFPAVVRLKPLTGSIPPNFVFAEIMNLQAMRDNARKLR